jgi:hypothetical protein
MPSPAAIKLTRVAAASAADPEVKSWAIVRKKGGWAMRTLLTQGERVLATDDTDFDTAQSIIGRIVREVMRESDR